MKQQTIIIDDHKSVTDALARLVEESGHDCQCFSSAEEFLEALASEGTEDAFPFKVLSDVRMPGMSGLDLVRRLKGLHCPIQDVALMSAYWTKTSLAEAHELGVKTFEKGNASDGMLDWLTRRPA